MKNLIFAVALIISTALYAQPEYVKTYGFVRVYNQDNQIVKGQVVSISDTAILLYRNEVYTPVPRSNITSIRTKHTAGYNILSGAATGGIALAIVGFAIGDEDNWFVPDPGPAAALGAVVGGFMGGTIGGIKALLAKPKLYQISGDSEKWKAFKTAMMNKK